MSVEFNHTIVWSHDSKASATFLAGMLGLPEPKKWGPFQVVATANGVNVDFMDKEGEIRTQHYAFLVSEAEFDQIFARVKEQGLTHWADPARTKPGRDQPSRRWTRHLFRGPERPLAGNHHATLRQQRLGAIRQLPPGERVIGLMACLEVSHRGVADARQQRSHGGVDFCPLAELCRGEGLSDHDTRFCVA